MSAAFIASAAELERVPDGTVISWLRIPGDHTSEAVAFVRREVETDHDDATERPVTREVVWVSPGGWDPQTIESAGVTFPATVIRWGEVTISDAPMMPLLPDPPVFAVPEFPTLTGGTWFRQAALDAAVTLCAPSFTAEHDVETAVLPIADVFERWLERDPEPEVDCTMAGPVPDFDE